MAFLHSKRLYFSMVLNHDLFTLILSDNLRGQPKTKDSAAGRRIVMTEVN